MAMEEIEYLEYLIKNNEEGRFIKYLESHNIVDSEVMSLCFDTIIKGLYK